MKKTELRRYVPPVPTRLQAENGRNVIAELHGELLVVTVYHANNTPQCTVFCSQAEKHYISWNYDDGKWSSAMIYSLLSIGYWTRRKQYEDIGDVDIIPRYLQSKDTAGIRAVQEWQKAVRTERLQARHKAKADRVHQVTDYLPAITPAIRRWVDNTIMADERYVYYERNRGRARGWCTHCRKWHEWTVDKRKPTTVPALDKRGKCPGCKAAITWKSINRSANFRADAHFQILTKTPAGLMVSIWYVYRRFERTDLNGSGKDRFTAIGIQIIDPDTGFEKACYDHSTRYLCGEQVYDWYEDSSDGKTDWRYSAYNVNHPLYPNSIRAALTGTRFQHLGLEEYARKAERVNIIRYLYHANKLPLIESAAKVGLARLVSDLLSRYTATQFNQVFICEDTGLRKALGVSAPDLKLLRQINADYKELEFLRECRKRGRRCDAAILRRLRAVKLTNSFRQDARMMLEHGHPDTVMRWLLKQTGGDVCKVADKYGDWYDYLEECKKLKWDIADKDTLFPQNLQNAHEQTAMLVSQKENAKKDRQIAKRLAELGELYTYETEDFFARPAQSAYELAMEGKALHHCVGGYAERMAEGKCIIILIRRKSNPDTPLTTAEMRGDRCIQIRAERNHDPIKAVEQFWKGYLKTVKKRLQEQRRAG